MSAPSVLIAKSGVGGAIDSHCLNADFMIQKGVPVLGAILNRAPVTGFYAGPEIAPTVKSFFSQSRNRERVFGILPECEALAEVREKVPDMSVERV